MSRFVDGQMAIVPWGAKAKFRRAKLGLLRKGSVVYIAIFFNTNDNYKFPIDQRYVEFLPSAIRFKDMEQDLFIRQVSDESRYATIIRGIKVLLKKDKLRQTGKSEALDKFISSIPPMSAFDARSLLPTRLLQNSVYELTLTDCNLTEIPKQLETFSATLASIDLSRNRIDTLPRTFCCKMNNLKLLHLSNNLIETLPIEIKFFRKLIDLNISNNRLRMLPSTFSDLRSLRNLNVANNNLSQLPAFRREEIRLKQLDVSHNPLDGASNEPITFEVYPSIDGSLEYNENLFCPLRHPSSKSRFPSLFEICMLKIVRSNRLLKLASEEALPKTIVSTMQTVIFKCHMCGKMSILPAYNSTDILEYVDQVEVLITTGNYRNGMTFMKLLCRGCFDNMSS